MKVGTQFPKPRILLILVFTLQVSISCADLKFRIPIPLPLYNFFNSRHPPQQQQPKHQASQQQAHHHHPQQHNHGHHHQGHLRDDPHHHHHNNVLNHAHLDQKGALYLHDPESTVKFYYKENMHGPSNRVDIHDTGCREIPMDYWYNRPKSLWAKHCITLYQSGHCKGEGVQVAGMVTELRSAGMHYGVNSFKPCEKNIRIKFVPKGDHKSHHHHHHRH